MNKRIFLILCLAAVSAFGQDPRTQSTAQEIEILLNSKTVTYAHAARFVLEAANALATDNSEEAFNYAVQQNWLPKNLSSNDSARLDFISMLLMRSFNIKGGIMYAITKSPRYAYRQLTYLNVIQGRSDPSMIVSGEQLLYYVTRILAMEN
ncbi:hypothetical protein [Treponema sp. R8-4-B8]